MSTQIARALQLLMIHDPELGRYVQETYNALQDVVNHFMPGGG